MSEAKADKASSRCFRLVCADWEWELVEALLCQEGYQFRKLQGIPWARELLSGPKALGSSLAAEFGLIYIQDKASLLPPWCLDPAPGSRILDLCASPGGKSGFLAQLTGPQGLVLANEPGGRRFELLRRNMAQLNLPQVICSAWEGQKLPLPDERWPGILLDAPCSGWGTADKHPRVLKLWQGKKLTPLLKLQQELLSVAGRLLAPGGSLLYSTCTTNVEENEAQALWAAEKLGLELEVLSEPPGFALDELQDPAARGCLRINGPGSGCQSFFLARLRKPETSSGPADQGQGAYFAEAAASCELEPGLEDFPGSLHRLPQGRIRLKGERVFFQPLQATEALPEQLADQGLYLGRKKGSGLRFWPRARLLLPSAEKQAQDVWHVEQLQSLQQLLSGQSLPCKSTQKQLGLYWRDLPLGWLTVKGGRVLWTDKG
ncbi:MAG: RsmB/NOP family class I SAM-dependent RNA methyltransferase [Desulfohalobiaceae bacterium]